VTVSPTPVVAGPRTELAAHEVELVVNAVLGSRHVARSAVAAPAVGGPLVRLSGASILGSVEVSRAGPSRHRAIGA
jgi:hypothetical protein